MRCLVRLGSRRHEPAICGSWSKSVDALICRGALALRGTIITFAFPVPALAISLEVCCMSSTGVVASLIFSGCGFGLVEDVTLGSMRWLLTRCPRLGSVRSMGLEPKRTREVGCCSLTSVKSLRDPVERDLLTDKE